MQKKGSFIGIFLALFVISLVLLNSSKSSFIIKATSFIENITKPVQTVTQNIFKIPNSVSNDRRQLKNENLSLTKKLINQEELIKENKALKDQFEIALPFSPKLLPAKVIGSPGFIPGISQPETFLLDQGEESGVRINQAVIFKDNLIGKISKISNRLSGVELITNKKSSFSAKTLKTNALGVVKGQGNLEMVLDNVLLSDVLETGDIVITKGDLDTNSLGLPGGLAVGKILSIEKKPSALFQIAKIGNPLDFSKIDTVFIITGYK
ncbi:MAG: rod shape-determining protein MreC [bacterium]|nr:rod shape-determining protein MreC [bacterium]